MTQEKKQAEERIKRGCEKNTSERNSNRVQDQTCVLRSQASGAANARRGPFFPGIGTNWTVQTHTLGGLRLILAGRARGTVFGRCVGEGSDGASNSRSRSDRRHVPNGTSDAQLVERGFTRADRTVKTSGRAGAAELALRTKEAGSASRRGRVRRGGARGYRGGTIGTDQGRCVHDDRIRTGRGWGAGRASFSIGECAHQTGLAGLSTSYVGIPASRARRAGQRGRILRKGAGRAGRACVGRAIRIRSGRTSFAARAVKRSDRPDITQQIAERLPRLGVERKGRAHGAGRSAS